MYDLEKIIRPFQRPTTIETRRIVANSIKDPVEPATGSFGKAGTLPAAIQDAEASTSGFEFKVISCDDRFAEHQRVTVPIKVSNPDDPDTFVMVDRIETISWKHFEKPTQASQQTADKTNTGYSTTATLVPPQYGVQIDESTLCKNAYKLWNKQEPGEVTGAPKTTTSPDNFQAQWAAGETTTFT